MNKQLEQEDGSDEHRREPRKLLRNRAEIRGASARPMQGTTTDISLSGLGLIVPDPLRLGQLCVVSFQAFNGRASEKVLLKGKVARCTLSGMDGYRAGIQIVQVHPNSANTIKMLVQ